MVKKILNDWVCEEVPIGINEISILFTNDKEIQVLNNQFRHKDKPTDVLSFPQIDPKIPDQSSLQSLGDIVISLETAKRQSKKYKVTFEQEILRLLIHSVLHLLGYDHEKVSKAKAQKMRRLEKRIYTQLVTEIA